MRMYLNGQWVDASDGGLLEVVNPALGQVVDTVPNATREDLNRALDLAVEGQKIWNAVPLHEKLAILERYACMVTEQVGGRKAYRPMPYGGLCQCRYLQNLLLRRQYLLRENVAHECGTEIAGRLGIYNS